MMDVAIIGRWNKSENSIRRHEDPRIITLHPGELKGFLFNNEEEFYVMKTNRDEDYFITGEELERVLASMEIKKEKSNG